MDRAVELMHNTLAAIDAGELGRLGEWLADDVRWECPDGTFEGLASVTSLFEAWHKDFTNMHHRPTASFAAGSGDEAFVQLHWSGDHTLEALPTPWGPVEASGDNLTLEACAVARLDDSGKISSWVSYWDNAAFYEQLGVMPAMASH
jgi:ketosteroid isomerase-like protein